MRAPSHVLLNLLLATMGATLILRAEGNLRYCFLKNLPSGEWLIAHMGAMIGAGIGSYTAFFVFGANRILSDLLTGHWSIIPWVLPGVAGGIAISLLNRKYRSKLSKSVA